jgi:hypothetical protein
MCCLRILLTSRFDFVGLSGSKAKWKAKQIVGRRTLRLHIIVADSKKTNTPKKQAGELTTRKEV